MKHWILYHFKYRRRQRRLELLHSMLGYEFALEYGLRRGWVEKFDGEKIWMAL